MHICINFVPLLLCNWWRKFRIFYQHFALIFPQNSCSLPSPSMSRQSQVRASNLRSQDSSLLLSGIWIWCDVLYFHKNIYISNINLRKGSIGLILSIIWCSLPPLITGCAG